MTKSFAIVALLVLCTSAISQISYETKKDYVYAVEGNVDAKGQQASGARTGGVTSLMQGEWVVAVQNQNATHYEMVANGFNFKVSVGKEDRVETLGEQASLNNHPLGDVVYFVQEKSTGRIPVVYYNPEDSPYYLNVKLGLINSFQTQLLRSGESKQVTESDTTGVHTSDYTGHSDVLFGKKFTQVNVVRFADPKVSSRNVELAAQAHAEFHSSGFMQSAFVSQHVVAKPGDGSSRRGEGAGFNSLLSSKGTLNVTMSSVTNAVRFAGAVRLATHASGSLHELASRAIRGVETRRAKEAARLVPMYARDPTLVNKVAPFAHTPIVRHAVTRFLARKSLPIHRRRVLALQRVGEEGTPVSPRASAFPFNRTVGKNFTLGGETVGLTAGADIFVGTNLNCKNGPNFNYEASALADASITVAGFDGEAFRATAVYGAKDGAHLANDVEVQLFGKTYWKKSLPTINCSPHTQQLAESAPGFTWSYTVWVSIIPVSFDAGAHLDLSVDLSWEICDTTLSASIDVNPAVDLVISGGADIDLLLLRAGVSIDASFQTTIIPEAFVKGTECSAGIDVKRQNDPMSASLDAFYQFKKCKILDIIDCKWEKRNDVKLWDWSLPASESTLFEKTWSIAQ